MNIKIAMAMMSVLFMGNMTTSAAELQDWNIASWCEKQPNPASCVANENAAKARLGQMDVAQDLINMLGEDISPGEQSYVLLESVVDSMRKK